MRRFYRLSATPPVLLIHGGAGPRKKPKEKKLCREAIAAVIAETSVLVKRFPPGDPIVANSLAMPIGAALLLAISLLTGETRVPPVRPAA